MDTQLLFRFRKMIVGLLLLLSGVAHAQLDTVELVDYTQLMIKVTAEGKSIPTMDVKKENNLGFFFERSAKGGLRICNDRLISVWVDGHLINMFQGCSYFETDELFEKSPNDTVFIAIYSKFNFVGLVCQQINFQESRTVSENSRLVRNTKSDRQDFFTVGMIIIMLLIGWTHINNSSRVSYLAKRMLSLKVNSYEFVDTSFFSPNNLQFSVFTSLLVGLLLDNHALTSSHEVEHFHVLILKWLSASAFIFMLMMLKWLFATIIAQLFRFKKMSDYQLFDLQNFIFCSFILIGILHFVRFTLDLPLQNFFRINLEMILMSTILMFLGWFGFKFIKNAPQKKLQIIFYLCATEMIPAVLFYSQILE